MTYVDISGGKYGLTFVFICLLTWIFINSLRLNKLERQLKKKEARG